MFNDYVHICVCTCRTPHIFRNCSESSGTSSDAGPSEGGRARACGGRLQRRCTSLLQSRQVRRGKIGPFLRRIARDCRLLPSALGLAGTNPAPVSLPQLLGIEWDLFRCRHLLEEVELELAVVGCSVVVPLFSATPLRSRQIEVVTACQFHYQSPPPDNNQPSCSN